MEKSDRDVFAKDVVLQDDSSKISEKKKRKLYSGKPLPNMSRQRITDGRRTYSQLLLNTFNSCDILKLKQVLARYCVDDLYSVCLYDGTNNPYAPASTEVRGTEGHISLWTALFKSAPDFLFEGEFVEAYFDPVIKSCVVRSKFTFCGTRVVDVKVAEKVNDKVIEEKLKRKEQFTTDESMLMAQIHAQLAASYSNNEGGCDIEGIGADLKAEQDFFDDSCFECPGSLDVFQTPTIGPASIADNAGKNSIFQSANINLDGAKIYTDSTPLNESLTMKCSGTLTVFLNEVHKIYKYEFLYIAMETV